MEFSDMVGKTLESIDSSDSERVYFHFADGTAWSSVHMSDCCESVAVDRIEGDVADVIGMPVLEAEEAHDNESDPPEHPDSWTWTRQRIRTENGEITIVWLGESNGYYGETPYLQITHGRLV